MKEQSNNSNPVSSSTCECRNGEDLQARVQKELAEARSKQRADLNRLITACWAVIILTFLVSYVFEVLKGLRDVSYLIFFGASMVLPFLFCLLHFCEKPDDSHYGVWVTAGYFVMYTFALITGKTSMVFSYILPMLSFMVLLHKPRLILVSGVGALILNVVSVCIRANAGQINLANSQDIEIQLALIIFCFAGAWLSSRLFDRMSISNEKAVEHALQQEGTIQGLEDEILIDKLTGIGNRAAYDRAFADAVQNAVPTGIIFCDVNGLKYCNDHKGHLAGDQLLRDVAAKLSTHFTPSNCYRISGDEFVVLIPKLDEAAFTARARRFYEDIWSEKVPMVGIGWDHSMSDPSEAIKNAEVRMYADKEKFYEQFPEYRRT